MKVFASLATILGVAYATPNAQQMHHLGQTSSMRSALQQHNVMHPSTENVMPSMRMSTIHQAQTDPNQYHLQDNLGNYEYAFKNQDSEKMEKGNEMSVRGRYAYIMSDGLLRRVAYIADNTGFHILEDNADNSKAQDRNKRSVEPDLIQTRMTSFMDSSSLRDNSLVNPNMYTSHMVGQDMLRDMMQKNRMNDMSSNHKMYAMTDMSSNLMGGYILNKKGKGHMMNEWMMDDRNRMGQEKINHNVMGQDISSKMMGQNMYSNMMDHDMSSNMKNQNVMGRDMSSNMMNRNKMGQDMLNRNMMVQDMSSNMMGQDLSSKIMGRNMYSNMMARDMSSNMMNRNMMGQDMNRLPLGQRNTMSQRMEIEQVPQSIASKRFF